MTVDWFRFTQGLTDRPVKGMLTGPYTMLDWSYNEAYPTRRDAALALAEVVRQEAEEFERAHAAADGSPTPFERMIGRRKDGTPLRACPVADPANEEARNDFLFRVDDYEGFHCPRGAHIRRGNPRDALGWDSASGVFASRLHRILRLQPGDVLVYIGGGPLGMFQEQIMDGSVTDFLQLEE